MFAAMYGHLEILQELIRNGARVDSQDSVGGTALMKAAARGHAKCVTALLDAKCIIDAEVRVLSYSHKYSYCYCNSNFLYYEFLGRIARDLMHCYYP